MLFMSFLHQSYKISKKMEVFFYSAKILQTMKAQILIIGISLILLASGCKKTAAPEPVTQPLPKDLIIDHRCTKLSSLPSEWIAKAKENFTLLMDIPPMEVRSLME